MLSAHVQFIIYKPFVKLGQPEEFIYVQLFLVFVPW